MSIGRTTLGVSGGRRRHSSFSSRIRSRIASHSRQTREIQNDSVVISQRPTAAVPHMVVFASPAAVALLEQTALGAQTWLEVSCVAYLCGRLRVEPT